jgi:hypothetical protein
LSSGSPQTDATHKWYPHGTVRAGIIWRSGVPSNYDQAFLNANLPRYDVSVPYAGHALANNGFDLRLVSDQKDFFAIWRCMSYEPSTWSAQIALAGQTQDPWTNVIYSQAALEANGALWLKYTPFNQVGRSPLPDLAESEMIAWPSLILYVITCTISAEPDRTTRNPWQLLHWIT